MTSLFKHICKWIPDYPSSFSENGELNFETSYIFSSDRPNIYSSDSEEGYDSDKEERGAKRLMKAKKLVSDEEVGARFS